jgi:hypothetical protein
MTKLMPLAHGGYIFICMVSVGLLLLQILLQEKDTHREHATGLALDCFQEDSLWACHQVLRVFLHTAFVVQTVVKYTSL